MHHLHTTPWRGLKTPAAHRFKGKPTTTTSQWKTDPGSVVGKREGLPRLLVTLRGLCVHHQRAKSSDQAHQSPVIWLVPLFLSVRPNLQEDKSRERKGNSLTMVCQMSGWIKGLLSYLHSHPWLTKSVFFPFSVAQEAEWRAGWGVRARNVDKYKITPTNMLFPNFSFFFLSISQNE